MRRLARPLAVAAAALGLAAATLTSAQPLPPRPPLPAPPPKAVRVPVAVHPAWPLKRAPRLVLVRPPRAVVRVQPARFAPVVVFKATPLARKHRRGADRLAWEDSETLQRGEQWTEFTLDCDSRGDRLLLEVRRGTARVDWAEVVFANGETQVVDFREVTVGPGLYRLLDFENGRHVDHVRVVARAVTRSVQLVLRMEK